MLTIFSDASYYNAKRYNLGVYIILLNVDDDITDKILSKTCDEMLRFVKVSGGTHSEAETILSALTELEFLFQNKYLQRQPIKFYTDFKPLVDVCNGFCKKVKLGYYSVMAALAKKMNIEFVYTRPHGKSQLESTNEEKIFSYIDAATKIYSRKRYTNLPFVELPLNVIPERSLIEKQEHPK